jgi:hypothetical protein
VTFELDAVSNLENATDFIQDLHYLDPYPDNLNPIAIQLEAGTYAAHHDNSR